MRPKQNWVPRVLELLIKLLLGAILAMIFLLVVLRYVFNTTIIGGNEATLVAFVFTSVFAAALALRDEDHIAIRYFTDSLSPRNRSIAAVLRWLSLLVINLALLVYSIVWIRQTGGFLMPTLGLPQGLAQISITIGCGLGLSYSAAGLRSAIDALTAGTPPEDEPC